MQYGTLIVEVTVAQQALPIAGAVIEVTNEEGTVNQRLVSGSDGKSPVIRVEAPDRQLSLDPNNELLPYATVDVAVSRSGYATRTFHGVQIFAQEEALLQVDMLNRADARAPQLDDVIEIPSHALTRSMARSCGCARGSCSGLAGCSRTADSDESVAPYVLDYPIIPKYITVHLGRPSASAQDVQVTFKDYIKNVASSEIYPTWPQQSLRANIYCQISLALNRVYTEWYRSRGYSFDITNSTAYDQYFVYGRDIFTSVSKIVDEIFNEYIRKVNTVNPFYAEYCDGRQVWCQGLKQWGTVDRANMGENAFEILQYYYGDDIELVDTSRIEGVSGSFPGLNLQRGVRSDSVGIIQNQLNRIAVNYPNIPATYPVDGIFGAGTEASVIAFQKQFSLTADGIVGKATWYKISYIYVAVKKLAELTSEGVEERLPGVYPGFALRQGDRNIYVQEVQFYLQKIALFTSRVPTVKIDSSFGSATRASVIAFQKLASLSVDGVVGLQTWNTLVQAYRETLAVQPPSAQMIPDYPGTALRNGSRGENVSIVQWALNIINQGWGNATQLSVDGIFGSATETAVRAFQRRMGLSVDGVVGRQTWNAISQQYSIATNNTLSLTAQNFEMYRFLYENYTSLIYAMDNHIPNL